MCRYPDEFPNVTVRLGGFNVLMSYLGSIGTIMNGSGLREAISTIYAPNSLDSMFNGNAYYRAVRGHFLIHFTLTKRLLESNNFEFSVEELTNIQELLLDFENEPPKFEQLSESNSLLSINNKFDDFLDNISKRGETAKLWIQYIRMINVLKSFIRAERIGDWHLHLQAIRNMLPYFQASGHHLYSKSAHLYLQDMLQLPSKLNPEDFIITSFLVNSQFGAQINSGQACGQT